MAKPTGRHCRVCEQALMEPTEEGFHLERSPIDPDICLGCWVGWIEVEKFLLRATGRTFWSLNVQEAMKRFLVVMQEVQSG
jgi:hypothetical protein